MGTSNSPAKLASALFGQARRAVLSLFFSNPDQSYYLRQIVRTLGIGQGAVQRELNRLAGAGILRRTVIIRQVHYQADAECPIFSELKSMILKTAGLGDILRSALLPVRSKIRLAFVYGSVARGEWKHQSDVDMLVVGDAGFEEIVSALGPAQQALGREVNPTVYAPEEFITKLAAKHHFLTSVVRQEKLLLIGDDRELARLGAIRLAHRTPK